MPRLDGAMQSLTIGKGGFAFTGARLERLEATDYTLVTIAVDVTGSVSGFEQELDNMLKEAVNACKKSARSDNLLVRIIYFSTSYAKGVLEVLGFTPLADVDPNTFPAIRPGGLTPLCDAVFSSVGATNAYAKTLHDNDYMANSIVFVITDGGDTNSTATLAMVKAEQKQAVASEQLESHISILIGVNTQFCGAELARFQTEAGMDQYVDAGDATPQKLAKLAQFVSKSVSSQSQALGTGGPSQNIAPTI